MTLDGVTLHAKSRSYPYTNYVAPLYTCYFSAAGYIDSAIGEADLRPNSTCLIRCGFVSTTTTKSYNKSTTNL